ncbi:MAG TPA: hypothetical protein VJ276_18750 [Thermoanaerobaculia bacterium]|nr:hypothetical protein [Thermoanaerobaculia bacterium]
MADKSQNLLDDQHLGEYVGAVISPVNYTEEETLGYMKRLRMRSDGSFSFVLDPQLYFPGSEEGQLPGWRFFPSQFRSGDYTSAKYWTDIAKNVATVGKDLHAQYVASPAVVPKVYDNSYFELMTTVATSFADHADDRFEPMQSLIVSTRDLAATPERAMIVASIVGATACKWIYLMLDTDVRPRLELSDAERLFAVMKLISVLERAGKRVLVGYTSSDVLLWKTAGATACATGKFFNVRRFTRSRFEDKEEGGGNLPYWFEESLLAFVRAADLKRLKVEKVLSNATVRNPLAEDVLLAIEKDVAWVKLSWVAYMWWFADVEKRLSSGDTKAKDLFKIAQQVWTKLDRHDVYMSERLNTGEWIQAWLQADADFRKWRDALS